jgi:hypothetical protein
MYGFHYREKDYPEVSLQVSVTLYIGQVVFNFICLLRVFTLVKMKGNVFFRKKDECRHSNTRVLISRKLTWEKNQSLKRWRKKVSVSNNIIRKGKVNSNKRQEFPPSSFQFLPLINLLIDLSYISSYWVTPVDEWVAETWFEFKLKLGFYHSTYFLEELSPKKWTRSHIFY